VIRFRALLEKELLDVARNRAVLLPVAIATLVFLVLPFVIAILIPATTGDSLGDDAGLARVSLLMGPHENLSTNGRVQLFIFQQFLIVFLLMPVTSLTVLGAGAKAILASNLCIAKLDPQLNRDTHGEDLRSNRTDRRIIGQNRITEMCGAGRLRQALRAVR